MFVSFDIFDTLILRNVYHFNDVFVVVAEAARRSYGLDCPDFLNRRVAAEMRARKIRESSAGTREVDLDQIYEVFVEHDGLSSADAEVLKKLELEFERRFCCVNPFMHAVYDYCRKKGKRIGIVSDMYLPQPFLENVLKAAGYEGYEFFLLSNACVKRKRDGSIFPLLIEKAGVPADRILHIGDDRVSDFEMPKKAGLDAWFYLRCKKADAAFSARFNNGLQPVKHDTPAMAVYNGLRVKKLFTGRPLDESSMKADFWYRLGYGKLGFVFLGFACWLEEQLRRESFDRVYFLSRDGFFIRQVYDIVSAVGKDALPSSSYLYVSRRSLAFALQNEDNTERLDLFCGGSEVLPVSAYLRRLGLDAADYSGQIRKAGFSGADQLVTPGRDDERLKKLISSFSGESADIAAEQKKLLLRYLEQEGLMACRKAAVVDIGWQGSMQKSLEKALAESGSKTRIKGFYLGTFADARRLGHDGSSMMGWLCDFSYPQHIRKTLLRCIPLLEFLHSAPHGSVLKYKDVSGVVEPVLAGNVINSQLEQAAEIQRGALDFVRDWLEATSGIEWMKPTRDEAFSILSQILDKPDRLELKFLGDLKHVDSFDGTADARYLAKPPGWPWLLNVKRLRREYLKSHWKKAFVMRLLNESLCLPVALRRRIKSWSR